MTSFDSREELANNGTFRVKVGIAMVKVATDVVGETPVQTSRDAKRHTLGTLILAQGGQSAFLNLFATTCAALGTLTTASTDADIEFTVAAIWDDLAGITGAEAAL